MLDAEKTFADRAAQPEAADGTLGSGQLLWDRLTGWIRGVGQRDLRDSREDLQGLAHDALSAEGNARSVRAQAMLRRAIDTYEQGFRSDLRNYYPGVNAATLRLLRGNDEDRRVLDSLTRVVRYSVAAAPPPKDNDERYWQTATKLELATAAKD